MSEFSLYTIAQKPEGDESVVFLAPSEPYSMDPVWTGDLHRAHFYEDEAEASGELADLLLHDDCVGMELVLISLYGSSEDVIY